MINVGNIQVREGASIPKAQHGTMTKGLAPAEYNIGIDPLVGPWESLSDLEAYMISSGRKDKQGNPLFINGQETTIVGSDGIPHKYIRSNGAWLAMNYSGGAVAYASDVYDVTEGKDQATINHDVAFTLDTIAEDYVTSHDIGNLTHGSETWLLSLRYSFLPTNENVEFSAEYSMGGVFERYLTGVKGNLYVEGIGGYTNTGGGGMHDASVHPLLYVIDDINTRLALLEDAAITSEDVAYDSTETYASGTVGYAIKQLETTGGGAGTSSGGISQSPQSGTNLSPSRTNTSFGESTNHDKLVPAELSTSLGQNSACSGKDTYSTGVSSFASGDNVLAKGDNSAAFGEGSFAFGDGSISVGVNDVMPCYIYVSRDSSYTGGSPRRYDVTIQPTLTLLNYDNEEVLDNMMIAIMPNHANNVIDGIVYAQLFDVRFDVDAQDNRFDQYMHAKVYISDEDLDVPYVNDYEQQLTHTIGESDSAYYGLLCRSANGKASATIGKNLMTSNEGEVAVGNCNVSHKKQTDLAGTIFSVGARGLVSKAERSNTNYDEWAEDEWYDPEDADATTVANVNAFFNTADCSSPSNALEVLDDGKVFIRGIGGFNGLNSTASGVKSVQEVISDLTQQVAALTSN